MPGSADFVTGSVPAGSSCVSAGLPAARPCFSTNKAGRVPWCGRRPMAQARPVGFRPMPPACTSSRGERVVCSPRSPATPADVSTWRGRPMARGFVTSERSRSVCWWPPPPAEPGRRLAELDVGGRGPSPGPPAAHHDRSGGGSPPARCGVWRPEHVSVTVAARRPNVARYWDRWPHRPSVAGRAQRHRARLAPSTAETLVPSSAARWRPYLPYQAGRSFAADGAVVLGGVQRYAKSAVEGDTIGRSPPHRAQVRPTSRFTGDGPADRHGPSEPDGPPAGRRPHEPGPAPERFARPTAARDPHLPRFSWGPTWLLSSRMARCRGRVGPFDAKCRSQRASTALGRRPGSNRMAGLRPGTGRGPRVDSIRAGEGRDVDAGRSPCTPAPRRGRPCAASASFDGMARRSLIAGARGRPPITGSAEGVVTGGPCAAGSRRTRVRHLPGDRGELAAAHPSPSATVASPIEIYTLDGESGAELPGNPRHPQGPWRFRSRQRAALHRGGPDRVKIAFLPHPAMPNSPRIATTTRADRPIPTFVMFLAVS